MIEIIQPQDRLERIRSDAETLGPPLVYAFLIDTDFFENIFFAPLTNPGIHILGDHRQRGALKKLSTLYRHLNAATWSYNRTMHDKSIIFPYRNVVWLTTANLNRGAWTLSTNGAFRITDATITSALEKSFYELYRAARRVSPTEKL